MPWHKGRHGTGNKLVCDFVAKADQVNIPSKKSFKRSAVKRGATGKKSTQYQKKR
jgi:hypothetical protein